MSTACVLNMEKEQKTVMEYMGLCLAYDMAFDFDIQRGVMDIAYHTVYDDYAQVYFSADGQFEQAFMRYDEEIHEYSPQDLFYETLELIRWDVLQNVYLDYGLIDHPRNRFKRRGDYVEIFKCLQLAIKNQCMIDCYGNIVKIETTRPDRSVCIIVISMTHGQYKAGMYRHRGITIDVPDAVTMQTILRDLEN